MKLDAFVKQTLLEITKGVADAQEETLLFIAPGVVNGVDKDDAQSVSFEVLVTVSSEAGGGISVFNFGDVIGSVTKETANRISFDVPVYFSAPTRMNRRHFSNEGSLNPVYKEIE